jgi:hypothetical protein
MVWVSALPPILLGFYSVHCKLGVVYHDEHSVTEALGYSASHLSCDLVWTGILSSFINLIIISNNIPNIFALLTNQGEGHLQHGLPGKHEAEERDTVLEEGLGSTWATQRQVFLVQFVSQLPAAHSQLSMGTWCCAAASCSRPGGQFQNPRHAELGLAPQVLVAVW